MRDESLSEWCTSEFAVAGLEPLVGGGGRIVAWMLEVDHDSEV